MFFNKKEIQIIVPGYKVFPFSMRESWKILFKNLNIPFRWIVHKEDKFKKTAEKIKEDSPVILINDHHLFDLVQYLNEEKKFGRGKDGRFWMGISTEKVDGSVFPRSVEKTRECARLCHFMVHFDKNADYIIRSAGAKAMFCHQYADYMTFKSDTPYLKKQNKLLWVGKLTVGNFSKAYTIRKKLFEVIKNMDGLVWREATNPDLKINKIVKERDSFKGLINLPSNCPGYTSNFFEHLAMGGCTIQYKTSYELPFGLEPDIHFMQYLPEEPESLLDTCKRFLTDPFKYEKNAQAGKQNCLKYHTLEVRVKQIFKAALNESKIWQNVSPKAKEIFFNTFRIIDSFR